MIINYDSFNHDCIFWICLSTLEMDRYNRQAPPPSSRGMRGSRGGSRSHHHNSRRQNGMHSQRSGSTLSLNGHSVMNGHHVDFELLSPTGLVPQAGPDGNFVEYPIDISTLTPMYPAVSEFIMPYVANGYFPTPFSPPPGGVIVDASAVATVAAVAATSAGMEVPQTGTVQAQFGPNNTVGNVTEQVRAQM